MTAKEEARQRTQLLKSLREKHRETVAHTQALLKQNKRVQREICNATREAAKTVPEIAVITGIAPHEVLWHVTAMKKYDRIMENGMCGDYYLYQVSEEVKR